MYIRIPGTPLSICFRINIPYFQNLAEMDLKGGIIGTGQEGGWRFFEISEAGRR
jgi:hypothetical protein